MNLALLVIPLFALVSMLMQLGGVHSIQSVDTCIQGVNGIIVQIDTSCCSGDQSSWTLDAVGYQEVGVSAYSTPLNTISTPCSNGITSLCIDYNAAYGPDVSNIYFYVYLNDGYHDGTAQRVVLRLDESSELDYMLQQSAYIESSLPPNPDSYGGPTPLYQVAPISSVYFDEPAPGQLDYLTGDSPQSEKIYTRPNGVLYIEYCGQECSLKKK